jgi:diacylglycerol O-acyltransferase / wax synthase
MATEKLATRDNHRQGPHEPLYAGDMDAVFSEIEKDALLRSTITAVLILDRVPNREMLMDRLERASRTLLPFRYRLVEVPLRLSTPRWLVDPNFDLSYHIRWIRAPGEGSMGGVLEFARQSAMSGLDRDRPLWTVTVVEGLENGQVAVILKMSHAVADGVGGLALLGLLGDPTREPRDLGTMPAIPEPESASPFDLTFEAVTHTARRILGFVGRTANSAARAIPTVVFHPVDIAPKVMKNLQALVRDLRPPLKALSPVMTERRGWMRFTALEFGLPSLRRVAKPRGCTVNDAFVTAVAHGFALYHQRHGKPVERLHAAVAVNLRKPGDLAFGNHVRGAVMAMPVGADDPAAAMATYHRLILQLREDMRLPSAAALDPMLNALGPAVVPFFGMMLKHCDFAVSNIPVGDQTRYLAGAKILGLYPFGPLMGTAANCTLVGYEDKAFVAINADAAAIPDLDMLAGCIREGFDAVIALGDVS